MFTKALLLTVSRIEPQDAAAGAVENWIGQFRSAVNSDGTQIMSVNAEKVECTQVQQKMARAEPSPQVLSYGPPHQFLRQFKRLTLPKGLAMHKFAFDDTERITRDARRIVLKNLIIQFAVTDPQIFKNVFGSGKRGLDAAQARIANIVSSGLRMEIGE